MQSDRVGRKGGATILPICGHIGCAGYAPISYLIVIALIASFSDPVLGAKPALSRRAMRCKWNGKGRWLARAESDGSRQPAVEDLASVPAVVALDQEAWGERDRPESTFGSTARCP